MERSERGHLPQVQLPRRLLHHGGRGISLHHGLARRRGIVIVAGAVQVTVQVPALILQRVGEFVGKRHGLHFRRNPVRDEHGFALGVIEARRLFRVKADHETSPG